MSIILYLKQKQKKKKINEKLARWYHSPPSSAEVTNAWSYTSTAPVRFNGVALS
jgi:hypothetical protein